MISLQCVEDPGYFRKTADIIWEHYFVTRDEVLPDVRASTRDLLHKKTLINNI